ncbi:MAG: hypothetical protein CMM67_01220 [Rhodospirillaceae bacterium]|nr:hypothetical protein [Rhodospirillaceae bacterium]OUT80428.1 MAG: hypothetical protein CBB83_01105 [Rhodospirillaceae bacterium TMED23]
MSFNNVFGGIARALSHSGYRLLWWSNGTNTVGRWIFKVSVGWLTWEMTGSTAWLGIVAFADTFPMVIMTIIAGVWADRIGYLRLMKYSQLILVIGGFITATLALVGALNVELIIILCVIVGSAEAMTIPARMSFVHNLVPKSDLSAAIALNSTTYNVARFLGPALFGILIQFIDISFIILVSAIMFFIFYIALFFQENDEIVNSGGNKKRILGDLLDGFRYALSNSGIFFLLFLLCVTAILIRPYIELVPGIADQVFSMGAEGVSIILSSTGLGATVGGVLLARHGKVEGLTSIFTWSLVISAVAMVLFLFSQNIWMSSIFIALVGMTIVAGSITSQTLIQNTAPDQLRARIISITAVLSWGLPAVGAAVMGWVAELIGLTITLLAGSIVTGILWIWAHVERKKYSIILEKQ